jgi:hypothetical protein
VSDALFRERVLPRSAPLPLRLRLWRPPWRIVTAAWSAVAMAVLVAFALDRDAPAAWAAGIVVALAIYLYPLPAWRRAPLELVVDAEALRVAQGSRRLVVPLDRVRAASVAAEQGTTRSCHGVGLTFAPSGRLVWDVPADGLGLVHLERTGGLLDLDVATTRPDELAEAVRAGAVRLSSAA